MANDETTGIEQVTKTISMGQKIVYIVGSLVLSGIAVWGIAVASAVKAQTDKTQDSRILVVESEVKELQDGQHATELLYTELLGVNKGISDTLIRLETGQTAQATAQIQIGKDMATVKTKVENLERVP